MRYSSTHRQETRDRLLKEASREIRAKGASGVAVAGVMARAGLTHGGFYAHFPSREAMIAEAMESMFGETRRRFDWANAAELTPAERLARYVDFYLSPRHRDSLETGCPLPALSGDFARSEGPARDRYGLGVQGLTDRLTGMLADLGDPEPQVAGTALLSELVGAVSLARAVSDPAQADAILANTRAAIMRRFNLDPSR